MKKKILGGLAVLVIAVVAAFNVNVSVNVQEDGLSDLSLTNIETLAYGEINPNCPNGCWTQRGRCYCNGWHNHYEAVWF